jgi:hypothetical protein
MLMGATVVRRRPRHGGATPRPWSATRTGSVGA